MPWSVAEIDALLGADKALFGMPEWVDDGVSAKLTSAIIGPDNSIIGGLSLRLNALVRTTPQTGNAVLVLEERPIQRLSFLPDHAHTNSGGHPIPTHLRFRTLPPHRSRIYLWGNNRHWPRDDNLTAGEALDQEPHSIDAAYKLFLEACGIEAYIPPPPWRPQLEL